MSPVLTTLVLASRFVACFDSVARGEVADEGFPIQGFFGEVLVRGIPIVLMSILTDTIISFLLNEHVLVLLTMRQERLASRPILLFVSTYICGTCRRCCWCPPFPDPTKRSYRRLRRTLGSLAPLFPCSWLPASTFRLPRKAHQCRDSRVGVCVEFLVQFRSPLWWSSLQ
eukprot:Lithocolla_globosa_v1_NODE_6908_length_1017_cov_4.357588.p2 type:complete len:170 gc:universal NODE_6908_length_1017_cov_4.357588:500-1009(+)